MLTTGAPDLLHIVGFLTGTVLYAMLFVMVEKSTARADRLALATAVLGLTWNLGALSASAMRALGIGGATQWCAAVSFGASGFLAAVVVHSVCRVPSQGASRTFARILVAIGYGSASVAAAMHMRAAALGAPLPSPAGLLVITAGLATLLVPLVVYTRRQNNRARALWMVALATFAVSALHLGRFHGTQESWPVELIGHHASIPLAFVILYQDYRFALADLFLKQALTLIALVTIVFGSYSMVQPLLLSANQRGPSPTALSALLAVWVVTALIFPTVARFIRHFVDRRVLGRLDYDELVARLTVDVEQHDSVGRVLQSACELLAPVLSAASVTWMEQPDGQAPQDIIVRTAEAPRYLLTIGRLNGGRRLLSDDLTMLERAATILARRIDALRLTEERYERMLHEREMRALASEAELRALRAQVNPHFLFNALTTVGYLIQTAPAKAVDTLMQLTTLLRSGLRSEGQFTTLGRERELVDCYLQIEGARFEERLASTVDIPSALWDVPIPSVIVQPLVENAVKHGIAKARGGGTVSVTARLNDDNQIFIAVRNTGAAFQGRKPAKEAGVGLLNVERRLHCYYGEHAMLSLRQDVDGSTVAELIIPASLDDDRNVTLVSPGSTS